MPAIRMHAPGTGVDFEAIRRDLQIPEDFPDDVLAEARRVAHDGPPQDVTRQKATATQFVTLDPPGSMDLDQAMFLERLGSGQGDEQTAGPAAYRIHYAIADVAAFVTPGGPLDAETQRRGQTFYSPDEREPLHPFELSEGGGSLLPDQLRPAVLWTIDLDAEGNQISVDVVRAMVRSVARLDYPSVQQQLDDGEDLHPSLALLPEIGALRMARARDREAITLNLPDVEVAEDPDREGTWRLELRAQLPVEKWNAEISLLTGMAAAGIMLQAGSGLLRVLPAPDEHAVRRLRRDADALGVDWPSGATPGDVVGALDPTEPHAAAFLQDALILLRGADYRDFDGGMPNAGEVFHAGVGAPYAHVTAPLRRLVDRFASEYCLAHAAGKEVPQWVTAGAGEVVETMRRTDKQSHALARRCESAVAGVILTPHIGQEFDGAVVQIDEQRRRATVTLADPPVQARADSEGLTEGSKVRVRLTGVDNDVITVVPVSGSVVPDDRPGSAAPSADVAG